MHMLKPHPHCDGIWQWGLWEVIGSYAQVNGICSLIKETWELPPLSAMWGQRGDGCRWARKQAFNRHWICRCLTLGSSTSRTMRKTCFLLKLPSPCVFAIAAWMAKTPCMPMSSPTLIRWVELREDKSVRLTEVPHHGGRKPGERTPGPPIRPFSELTWPAL